MRKLKGIFALWVAMLLIAGATGIARAADGDLKVNGFAAILFPVLDQNAQFSGCIDHKGENANCIERYTQGWAEVDFDYTKGPVKFRLDLDVPSLGYEATGFGVQDVGSDIGIEQARFDWMVPGGEAYNLTVTGGAFNAPIGFESQDDPDMYQITNGQLFFLVPSNLAGFMVSGSQGPVSAGIFYGNDFRGGANKYGTLLGEENTVGVHVNVTPIEPVSLDVTYLSAPYGGDDDILDAVLTGSGELAPMVSGLLSGEYVHDRNNDGFAIVANLMHKTESYPHGLTLRYDQVHCDKDHGSFFCGPDQKPTTLTAAGTVYLTDTLSTVLEWNRYDPDISGVDSTDQLLLEFVATFG